MLTKIQLFLEKLVVAVPLIKIYDFMESEVLLTF